MNAPKISQTVAFEKPDNPQVRAAFAALNPGLASSAGLNSTQGESTVTVVTPMMPIAPPGNGSRMRPTMTPAKIAKKYQACCGRPGAGITASRSLVETHRPRLPVMARLVAEALTEPDR